MGHLVTVQAGLPMRTGGTLPRMPRLAYLQEWLIFFSVLMASGETMPVPIGTDCWLHWHLGTIASLTSQVKFCGAELPRR